MTLWSATLDSLKRLTVKETGQRLLGTGEKTRGMEGERAESGDGDCNPDTCALIRQTEVAAAGQDSQDDELGGIGSRFSL